MVDFEIEYLAEGGIFNALKRTTDTVESAIVLVIDSEPKTIGKIILRPIVLNEKRKFELIDSYRIY